MSRITTSACLPTSRLPIRSNKPSARAACAVTPIIASAGLMRICVQAIVMMSGSDSVMHPPGLQPVAKATFTPLSSIFRAGA